MSDKRIGIGARPLADPQAEAWIRQGVAIDHGKVERYSARLTLDVTPALRTCGLRPRHEHGGDSARSAGATRHVITHGDSPGMANADTANRHISALGWTVLATSPPRLIYNTSDSVPAGRYRNSPINSLSPGDLMLVHLMQWLAARLPAGEGTVVGGCGDDGAAARLHTRSSETIRINGVLAARRLGVVTTAARAASLAGLSAPGWR